MPGKSTKATDSKAANAPQVDTAEENPSNDAETVAEPRSERKKGAPGIAYPPYVNAYGAIPKLFQAITAASVPPKFNQDFMESVLDMRSSSHRALIPLLKRLGFLDQANVPTEQYRRVRDKDQAGRVMAQQVRAAYGELYKANEYAHRLDRKDLAAKLTSVLGAAEDDPNIPSVVGTFLELKNLANFADSGAGESEGRAERESQTHKEHAGDGQIGEHRLPSPPGRSLGISYTINLNLPATTEIDVFNAIFKALKEHILGE